MRHALLLFLLCYSARLFALPTDLYFTSTDTTCIKIALPVDGTYNQFYYQDTLCLYPGKELKYTVDLPEFSVIHLQGGSFLIGYELYATPGARYDILYRRRDFEVSGVDSDLNNYINHKFSHELTLFADAVGDYLRQYIPGNVEDLSFPASEVPSLGDYVSRKELLSPGNLPSPMQEVWDDLYRYRERNIWAEGLKGLLVQAGDSLSASGVARVEAAIDSIYQSCLVKEACIKFDSGVLLSGYWENIYEGLGEEARKDLQQGYDDDTFGPNKRYLCAPKQMLLNVLFEAFVFQYVFRVSEFDRGKMLAFLHDNYPDSESYEICRRLYEADKMKKYDARIEETPLASLHDLMAHRELKGKRVLVDLWATWCIPCVAEFAHYDALHELVSSYENLQLVSVSIDRDKDHDEWRKRIHSNKLSGLHFRASLALWNELEEKVYGGKRLSIPRFILLDSDGTVMDGDLPLPSEIQDLRKALNKVLWTFE